ncbi:hypothetical protein [Thermocoleostomius sinensis]|jgi:hypothetical protein|uniref:Uncharacterized protein n=1 Tax=Thermocoleostomius sinensis A174 TaxID=2016057 RepID=A0A9E9C887_9CYAN|nr:hypothetical protein [Thermocoleostomius sinensis]WAL61159.1 hypothetical protein OXH18_03920 [Thermocoleostomius sinensis A174]
MTESVTADPIVHLQECVSLVIDRSCYAEANQAFTQLKERLATDDPLAAKMLELLWDEMLSARRSASFWEQLSDIERQFTEQMAASHVQLQQNYLRLIQEQ